MDIQHHYATVSVAIEELRDKGYTEDFNITENWLTYHSGQFAHDEFEISDIYFYEGESNPDDKATVYGIVSTSGVKGVLVTGNDTDLDPLASKIVSKLLVHRNDTNQK